MDFIIDNPPKDISYRDHSTGTRRMSTDNGIMAEKTTNTTRQDSVASQDDNEDQYRNFNMDVDTHAAKIVPIDKSDHRRRLSSGHRSSSDPGLGRKRAANFAIETPRFAAKHPRTIRKHAASSRHVNKCLEELYK